MNFYLKKAGKCISVLLVALLVLSSAPLSGFAGLELPVLAADAAETVASGSCGDSVTWTLDEDGVLTLSGTGATNDYTIEEGGRSPFYDHADAIQTLVVADGITGIGQLLFAECTALSSVSIPDSVTFIGAGAFYYCSALTSFDVPDEVTALGEMIFYNCYSLVQIDLSAALTSIGSYAFYDCNALVSVNIPSGVTSIGEQAFGQCDGLVSVTLPDTLTVVGASAFAWCSALTGIELPESVGTVCEGAFADCPAMEKVIVRNAECVIEGDAENSAFPAQAVIYGRIDSTAHVFAETYGRDFEAIIGSDECGKNATWSLVDGVLTISGTGKMYDYSNPANSALAAAPWHDLADSVHTVIIEDGITHIGAWAFDACDIDNGVTISDSVTSIGDCAFRATSLQSVTIPAGVTSIGDGVFGYNYVIREIIVDERNENYIVENGTLYDIEKTTLLCCANRNVESFVVPSTVKKIGTLAFCNCKYMSKITVPEGVQTIGNAAFWDCDAITSIHIPSTVTYVADSAFSMMQKLETITVSASNPYYTVVDNVLYDRNKTTLLRYAPQKTDTSFVVPQSVTRIDSGAFSDCENLVSVFIPESVISIGWDVFENCTALTDVNIPSRITELNSTFAGCSSLENITIPYGVVSIGDTAFLNCESLTSVVIPDSVVRIDKEAFSGCSSLAEINIPADVTFIGDAAFKNCFGLTAFTVDAGNDFYMSDNGVLYKREPLQLMYYPTLREATEYSILDGVVSIDEYAFDVCLSLQTLNIPASVESIYEETFVEMESLSHINVAAENETYMSDNGVLYSKDQTHLVCYPRNKEGTSFTVPETVTHIDSVAFAFSPLTQIIPHDGIVSIGDAAFAYCEALETYASDVCISPPNVDEYIPESPPELRVLSEEVTEVYWGAAAFGFCSALERVVIPEGVKAIQPQTFLYCTSLTSVELPSTLETIDQLAFAFCSALPEFDIPASVTAVAYGAFGMCESMEKVTVNNAQCVIDDYDGMTFPEQAVIYGYADSTAQTYAETYDREFVAFEVDCEHTWNSGEVITAPTCCEEGSMLYLCTVCGESKTEPIAMDPAAHGENTELRGKTDATATQNGYTGDLYCLDCEKIITEGEVIPAEIPSSFRLESDGIIDEDGIVKFDVYLDDFVGLTAFNLYIDFDETLFTYAGLEAGADALALNTAMSNELYLECNEHEGQVEMAGAFVHALYSAEHYNNAAINSENFHVATVLLQVKNESVNTLQLTATSIFEFAGCTQDDFTYPALGFVEDLTAQLNASVHSHDWVLTETVQGTCTQAGSVLYTCSVCGETKTETGTTDPNNHAGGTEVRNAVTETCGKDGYTGDTYCLGCGVKIESGTVIPATGNHTWDGGVVTLEPTYTAPGVRTFTCGVCGATRTEGIAQLESVYVDDDKSAVMEDVGLVAVAGNTVSDFLANASDGTVILDRDGKEMKPDAIPGTGATLVLPDGTEHTIVVLGDINGDGRVLAGDARLALRSAVGLENLMDAYYAAADVDNIAQISVADARMILRASVHLEDPADWFESTVQ